MTSEKLAAWCQLVSVGGGGGVHLPLCIPRTMEPLSVRQRVNPPGAAVPRNRQAE